MDLQLTGSCADCNLDLNSLPFQCLSLGGLAACIPCADGLDQLGGQEHPDPVANSSTVSHTSYQKWLAAHAYDTNRVVASMGHALGVL